MSFFAGFSGEFGKQLERSRTEEADRAERANALESSVLQSLVDSPDPEIASHALTGLLDLAGPQRKAKGLGGWLGKVAAHPAMPTIRQLISQGRQVQDQPEQLPSLQVQGGLPGEVGEPLPSPTVPGATGAPPTRAAGPASSPPPIHDVVAGAPAGPARTASQPSATTPPPMAAFAPGGGYKPATSKTVPRQVFRRPGEEAGEKETAVLKARGDAYDQFAGTPGKQQLIPGVDNQTTRAAGEVQDESGNWFKQDWVTGGDGAQTLRRTPISKVAPRPTAPEAKALERAHEILATTPGLTPEQALEMSRAEGRQATLAKVQATADTHLVRTGQIKAMVPATIAAWQRVNGTVPMTRAQAHAEAYRALSASRMTLGGGPDVTVEDITRMADGLLGAVNLRHAPTVSSTREGMAKPLAVDAPPAPGGAPGGQASPGGVAAPPTTPGGQPSAATPPPGPGTLTSAVPEDLAQTNPKPRQLAAGQQDERTLMEQLLTLAADARTDGDAAGWSGVGGMGAGSIGQFLDTTFGDVAGDPAQIASKTALRNKINHIFGVIGLLQGGKTLTATEKGIVKGYAPTINQSIPALKANLEGLEAFFKQKMALQEQNVSGRPGKVGGGATAPPPAGGAGGAGGAGQAAQPAGAVPPAVAAALKGLTPGKHTLSDGSVWVVDASGQVRPGG